MRAGLHRRHDRRLPEPSLRSQSGNIEYGVLAAVSSLGRGKARPRYVKFSYVFSSRSLEPSQAAAGIAQNVLS